MNEQTNMSDLVSIIMPIYNSEKFLKESLESILQQTWKNIEIIAVNDGSTDDSFQILEKYSDKIQIINQKNSGLAHALNAGLEKISGNWFKWFSPDDLMFPNTIETLVYEAKKHRNTIIYSNWEIIDENNKKLRTFSESNYNNLSHFEFIIRLLDGQQINVNTTLIPTSIIKKGCSFRELKDPIVVDYDFFLRAALQFNVNFHLIEKPLIKYRIHQNQLSHKNIKHTLSYLEKLRDEILFQLDGKTRNQYLQTLKNYQKQKPLLKKTMDKGLKLTTYLPNRISDNLLIFYLNNIRKTR